jgi:hypothetical protein
MIIFFVNNVLNITLDTQLNQDQDKLYTYNMNFLTMSSSSSSSLNTQENIKLVLEDDNNNIISKEFIITNKPTKLTISCSDFMYTYNWRESKYIKISYKVLDLNNLILYTGSFPLIDPTYQENLRFGYISCNNNQNKNDCNDYDYKYPSSQIHLTMWERVLSKNFDILVFLGDQIYSNYIITNKIGLTQNNLNTQEIYDNYSNLYKTAYSEINQSNAMRNSIVISLMGDHDVSFDKVNFSFDKVNLKENIYLQNYYIQGLQAFKDYSLNDQSYFNLLYGKYNIIALDNFEENLNLRKNQLNFIQEAITKHLQTKIILLSSKPLGNLNKFNAYINSNYLEMFHPNNYENTLDLLATLDYSNFDRNKEIVMFSGGLEATYSNKIYSLYNNMSDAPILTQLVVGSISRKTITEYNVLCKLKKWLKHKLTYFYEDSYNITTKEDYYVSNSFGVYINNLMWSCVDGDGVVKETNFCLGYN